MEIIAGVELIDFFNQAKRQEEKYLRYVFLRVADALQRLHAAGVAHRDIKPENVMLTEAFEIKLIDLGYGVRLAGNKTDGFNRTRLGTEMYMAPEIVAGQPYQGADIDIFAFGVMLLVMRLMAYPFDEASLQDKAFKEIYEKPHKFWAEHADKGVSEEFKSLTALLLAPEAGARPTMADVLGHEWMRGEVAAADDFHQRFASYMERAVAQVSGSPDALDVDFQIATAGSRRGGYRGEGSTLFDGAWAASHAFKPVAPPRLGQQCTTFAVLGKPLEIMGALHDLLSAADPGLAVSKGSWRLTFTARHVTQERKEG